MERPRPLTPTTNPPPARRVSLCRAPGTSVRGRVRPPLRLRRALSKPHLFIPVSALAGFIPCQNSQLVTEPVCKALSYVAKLCTHLELPGRCCWEATPVTVKTQSGYGRPAVPPPRLFCLLRARLPGPDRAAGGDKPRPTVPAPGAGRKRPRQQLRRLGDYLSLTEQSVSRLLFSHNRSTHSVS